MPPRAKVAGGLVGLTASDSEPDFDDVLEAQPALSTQPIKRPRGRPPAASKVTKPAQKQVRGNSVRPTAKAQASPRRALADKARNTAVAKPSRADKSSTIPDDDVPMLEANLSSPVKPAKTARGRPKATKDSKLPGEHVKEDTSFTDAEPTPIETEQYQTLETEEDASDATVRRKLGDLARKYESLEARHREMRQVGILEADRNFERLQKQADESAAAASKLINELKAELAKQSALARKGEETRKQLERSETRCEGLKADVADVNESLAEANSQIKTLSTKLAAFRSTEATVAVPGSALKAGAAGNRAVPSDVVQAAQAKEDLYGDLTGLILRGVSLGKEEDVFDCIQTGRNGTLHFKLALDKVDNYDDVQVTYRPQLDESRDEELIDLLPDYLVEEISFARSYAAKFYSKVVKPLTE